MKILFITFFFPPYKTIASIRTGKTAKLLYEMGYDIKVVTAKNIDLKEELSIELPFSNLYQTDWMDFDKSLLKILGKNKQQAKNSLHQGGKKSFKTKIIQLLFSLYKYFFYTPDKYIGWYSKAYKQCDEILQKWRPDIIYASATPYTSLMIASKLSQRYSIPFVAELRDLWSDNHYDKQYFLGKYLEFITLRKASAIITVSTPLVDQLQLKYPKISCYEVRNAFDEEDFIYQPSTQKDKVIILYAGMVYAGKRDPSILFQAIKKDLYLKQYVKCMFYGDALGWIKSIAMKYGIENNVEVHQPINREQILKLQAESDILLLLTWDNPQEKGIFTGKLFEYIGSAKPILSIGAIHDIASQTIIQNGFGIASNNIDEIIHFIKSIKNNTLTINEAYCQNRIKFERRQQVQLLSQIFHNIILNK